MASLFIRCSLAFLLLVLVRVGPMVALCPSDPEPLHGGKTLSEWVKLLKEGNPDERLDAALALNALGPKTKPALADLIAALKGPGSLVRYNVGQAIAQIGADAVAPLRDALKSPSPLLRSEAVSVLGRIGQPARQASPAIAELLHSDPDKYVRHSALYVLAKLDPKSQETKDRLKAALKDADDYIQLAAGEELWNVAQDPAGVPVLVGIMKNPKSEERFSAIQALGRMGAGARDAVPELAVQRYGERFRCR